MLRRRALLSKEDKVIQYVDLGLPSGLMWAIGNLCKDSQGSYYIGEETDRETYVSWGNIDGHNRGEGYNFNTTNYNATAGKQVSGDISPTDAQHDICLARLGSPWHMPTKDNFLELYNYTDSEFVSNYKGTGVSGMKFMKKTDHSVYVFFPFTGWYEGTTLNERNQSGRYNASTFINSSNAYYMRFYNENNTITPDYSGARHYGRAIRPVQ